jgi:hypothetical protein
MLSGSYEPDKLQVAGRQQVLAQMQTFVAFFACFFSNQCYDRWSQLYGQCMTIQGTEADAACLPDTGHSRIMHGVNSSAGSMNNITLLLRTHIGKSNPRVVMIVRHLQLAHLLGYVGLSAEYDNDFYVALGDKYKLHTQEERASLLIMNPCESGSAAFCEVIAWVMANIAAEKRGGAIDAVECNALLQQAMSMRGAMLSLYDLISEPIPFA